MGLFSATQVPKSFNVCLITKKFPHPGRDAEENYLWPMARGLVNRGHNVTVLSWKNPRGRAQIESDSVRAYFLGEKIRNARVSFSQLAYEKFLALNKQQGFHIVHSLDESGLLIGLARKQLGIAMTYDVSATQMAQLFSILGMAQDTVGGWLSTGLALFYKFVSTYYRSDRKILKTADGVFVSTPQQKIMLERYYMYPELRTFVVPYGMDYIELDEVKKSDELRQSLGLLAHSQVIVTFTDMTEFDEVANLLSAFQKLVVKKPNSRLIIVGNGPLKSEIEFEMLNLALGSKVIFAGTVPGEELMHYIALADIYINLSSRTTGFEPTMLSAMSQKKIVIGSELSPIATIIVDGKNGFLVKPAGTSDITELIGRIFKQEVSAEEIGIEARKTVLNLFDIDKMVDQILVSYKKVYEFCDRHPRPVSSF